ncbi:MAG: class I SAM-dependent methyltransferase [Pseudomonadota bacterium]
MNLIDLPRGYRGLLPRTTRLADESYLDFVETFRGIAGYGNYAQVAQVGDEAVSQRLGDTDDTTPIEEIRDVINALPFPATWQRLMRSHQEMMWRRTRGSFLPFNESLEEAMAAAESQGPGRLTYDPNFTPPTYARREIHLQPGGYTDDPIGGVVYHYGTKVFYAGGNDQDELHAELVDTLTPPEDGTVNRVLDLACSIGQATVLLKDRFPDAEVTGLDVALPLLRYGHYQAVARNQAVNYVQGLSEDLPFDDGHFDTILSYILFHEIPVPVIKATVREVFRVLRPGGTFCIYEFPSAAADMPASQRWLIDYDSNNNCEPYSPGFVYLDFHELLREAGFELAPGPENSNGFLQTIVATRPSA